MNTKLDASQSELSETYPGVPLNCLGGQYAKENQREPSGAQPLERVKNSVLATAPRLARVLDALRFSRFNRRFSFRNSKSFTRISKTD